MRYLIHDSRYKDTWDAVIMVLAVVTGIEIPLRLVLEIPMSPLFYGLDICLTIFFSLDVILNLTSPIPDADETAETNDWINYQYLKSWFLIDLLAAIPFALILSGLPINTTQGFKSLRLVRLARLLKLTKMVPLMRKWGQLYSLNPSILRLTIFFLLVTFTAHWMACGWISLSNGTTITDATTTYVTAIYWVVTTMTTVGYGDITPTSNVQYIYSILVMMIGVATYGYVIANLANFLGNIDTARMDFSRKMSIVDAFLAYRNVPTDLEQRIRNYYHYVWENRLDHDENEVINDLPDSLQTEIALFLRRPLLSQVPLFRKADSRFLEEIVHHLKIHIYMPGDTVVRRGERGNSMYFVSKGMVRVLDGAKQDSIAILGEGSFFGETSLLREQPRNATVMACNYCNIYSLDRQRFNQLLAKYPDFRAVIEKISAERES